MGMWSDGTPVVELSITDESPSLTGNSLGDSIDEMLGFGEWLSGDEGS